MTSKKEVSSAGELALITVKAGLASISGGGVLSVLLDHYIPTTWQKRQEELLEQIREDFERLKIRLNNQRLSSEDFHITMIKIIRDAIVEPHKEKQEAFRAILINETINPSPNLEIDFFIKITEDLTCEHIGALKILANPQDVHDKNPAVRAAIDSMKSMNRERLGDDGIIPRLLTPAMPSVPADHWLVVLDGLTRSGLIVDPGMARGGVTAWTSPRTPQDILQKRTTSLGDRYIQFITLP